MSEGLAGWWVGTQNKTRGERGRRICGSVPICPDCFHRSCISVLLSPLAAGPNPVPANRRPSSIFSAVMASTTLHLSQSFPNKSRILLPLFPCSMFHVPWEKEGLGVSWRHENHRSRLSCTKVDHVFGLAPRQKWKGKKRVSAAFAKKGSKNNHGLLLAAQCWTI